MADEWYGIDSSSVYSYCGWTYNYGDSTLENALDGNYYWAHEVQHVHWFILDLGDVWTVKKLRGRSNALTGDPTDVDVYVSDYESFNWLLAASRITLWQDRTYWIEWNCTDIHGRYVLVEVWETEDYPWNWIYWGGEWPSGPFFPIFDIYGCPYEVPVYLSGQSTCGATATGDLTYTVSTVDLVVMAGGESSLEGTLSSYVELSGTTGGEATITDGWLHALVPLYGLTGGRATITDADLISTIDRFEGEAVGRASVEAELFSFRVISGIVFSEINAEAIPRFICYMVGITGGEVTVTDADLTNIIIPLSGTIGGEATVTDADLALAEVLELAGQTICTSTTEGKLRGIVIQLSGLTGGEATITSGVLSGIPLDLLAEWIWCGSVVREGLLDDAIIHIDGTSICSTTTEATLSGILAIHYLTGTVVTQSNVYGEIGLWRWDPIGGWYEVFYEHLDGTITCVSSLPSAHLIKERAIAGAISCSSGISATLGRVRELISVIPCRSSASGSLSVTRELTGTIANNSTVTADLITETLLAGTVSATSSITGSAKVARKLQGVITALSNVSGGVSLPGELIGTVTTEASVAGSLSVSRELNSTPCATRSVINGSVLVTRSFLEAKLIRSRSAVSGLIKSIKKLIATVTASSGLTGDVRTLEYLIGTASVSSTVTGSIKVARKIACEASVSSVVTGSIKTTKELTGEVISTNSTTSANLTVEVLIVSTVSLTSVLEGHLSLEAALRTVAITQSTINGSVEVVRELVGTITCSSSVSGTISAYVIHFVISWVTVSPVFEGSVKVLPAFTHSVGNLPIFTQSIANSPVLASQVVGLPIFEYEIRVNEELKVLV